MRDLALLGGRVLTPGTAAGDARAVGIREGRIVAVGADDAVRAACGRDARVVDLDGAVVVPGLVDAHQHPFWGARATRGADLTAARDLDDVRAALLAERDRVGPGQWVLGHGLRRQMFPGRRVHRRDVDEALPGTPVFATFADGHSALASGEALRRAGVTSHRTFPDAAEIVCDDDGPTGELVEPSAMDVVRAGIPPLTAAARRDLYAAVLTRMAAAGLTGVHVMDSDRDVLGDLAILEDEGRLPVRVVLALWRRPGMTVDDMRADLPLQDRRGRLWRTGAVKFFLDGVTSSGTAWLTEPDAAGRTGGTVWEPDRYAEAVALHAAAGVACVTHAIGDRAARHVLDVYAGNPPAQRPDVPWRVRHRLEHAQLLDARDVPRFLAHDVVASMQPVHIARAASLAAALGPGRADAAWPCGTLRDAGAVLALGSDWPVAPFPPLLGLAWAVLRREPGAPGATVHADAERLTIEQALSGHTAGAAYAVGEEAFAGAARPGHRADLTLLADDPRTVAPDRLPDVAVVGTVVDGTLRMNGGA